MESKLDELREKFEGIEITKKMFYTVQDVEVKINNLYIDGRKKGIDCGFEDLYDHYSVLPGATTYINGPPDSGKTFFWFECLINMAQFHGWKHAIYSPEMGDVEDVYEYLIEMYMQKAYRKLTPHEVGMGKLWVSEHFIVIDPQDEIFAPLDLFEQVEMIEKQWGEVNTITGDPWNEFSHTFRDDSNRQDLYIERILGEIRKRAKKIKKHICIITHPRDQEPVKSSDGSTYYKAPHARQYAGGQAWYRKGLAMLCIWRPPQVRDAEGNMPPENELQVQIQKAKPRGVGKKGTIKFYLDFEKLRYYQMDEFSGIKRYAKNLNNKHQ